MISRGQTRFKDPGLDYIPEIWRDAAEEIRAHLVMVRGGAPFLSPRDGWRLVGWLEDGVEVPVILCAIERAAAYRRRKASRLPLTLGRVGVHLRRELDPGPVPAPAEPDLSAVTEALRRQARDDPHHARLTELADALDALDGDAPTRFRTASAAGRVFVQQVWEDLDDIERSLWLEAAEAELRDKDAEFFEGMAEPERRSRVEERARAWLRGRYPAIEAGSLAHALHLAPSRP